MAVLQRAAAVHIEAAAVHIEGTIGQNGSQKVKWLRWVPDGSNGSQREEPKGVSEGQKGSGNTDMCHTGAQGCASFATGCASGTPCPYTGTTVLRAMAVPRCPSKNVLTRLHYLLWEMRSSTPSESRNLTKIFTIFFLDISIPSSAK